MHEILSLDAMAQLEALSARKVSARELLEASLARADAVNTAVNAVVVRDVGQALDVAREIDERRAKGEVLGRLAGLPMTVKDTFDAEPQAPIRFTYSSRHGAVPDGSTHLAVQLRV